MKLCLICALLFLFTFNVKSQEKAGNKHAFGVAYGTTTGNGLSYRYHPSKWGMQIAFSPNIDEYTHNVYAGLTFLYRVTDNEKANFFFYNGNRVRFSEQINYYLENGAVREETIAYNLGFGVGLELIMFKRLSFNLMAGYGAYRNFRDITFSGEISLLYRL